jgi:hypothetical protein
MLEVLLQIVDSEGIDCGWKRVDGYLFPASTSQEDFEALDQEMAAYIRAGQTDVRKVPLRRSCSKCPPLLHAPLLDAPQLHASITEAAAQAALHACKPLWMQREENDQCSFKRCKGDPCLQNHCPKVLQALICRY